MAFYWSKDMTPRQMGDAVKKALDVEDL